MQQSLVKFSQVSDKYSCNTYAGVSGLTTATLLLQQEKGIKVHIVAKHFPGDLSGEYTSPWYINVFEYRTSYLLLHIDRCLYYRSGAFWRSDAAKDDTIQQGMSSPLDKTLFIMYYFGSGIMILKPCTI